MSVNKVILVGNLGRDPELRHTQSGQAVASFSLATNERWKDRDGQQQEKTEWHRIVAWGRTAEICAQYLSKGRQIYIEGRLQTREWEDRDGNKRYTTEIVTQTMQMLGRRGEGGGSFDGDAPAGDPTGPDPGGPGGAESADGGSGGSGGGDDIPF